MNKLICFPFYSRKIGCKKIAHKFGPGGFKKNGNKNSSGQWKTYKQINDNRMGTGGLKNHNEKQCECGVMDFPLADSIGNRII